jgi:hypothetical protein
MEHSSGRIGRTDGEFHVCQFFEDDTYEYVRRYVGPEEAVKAFQHYTSNIAVKMGIIKKVIITDGGDCIAMEWQKDKGITFPTQQEMKNVPNGN